MVTTFSKTPFYLCLESIDLHFSSIFKTSNSLWSSNSRLVSSIEKNAYNKFCSAGYFDRKVYCLRAPLAKMEDNLEVLPAKRIRPIGGHIVHQICSGQVVLDLAIAVKELVENSLDAGATLIEIKLTESGFRTVEVADNGSGIRNSDFQGLTAKYYTSKLREFVDLENISTLGFRGEALCSLCALSNVTIITRHTSANVGTKLEMDHYGNIIKSSQCARPVGTTVILTGLFSTLPVRRKQFSTNIKKECNKMIQILHAYCIVSTGVRFICTNQLEKSKRVTLFCTSGSNLVTDNIQAIFGARQSSEIIKLKEHTEGGQKFSLESLMDHVDLESTLDIKYKDIETLNSLNFKMEGFISSCSHGSGRGAKDRQYFYINSRPCEPKNVIKLVNEVYNYYNPKQYPFVYLNLNFHPSNVDINITPDKRQLLIQNEKIILFVLKRTLIKTFEQVPSRYTIQNPVLSAITINGEEHSTNSDEIKMRVQPNKNSFRQMLSQWKSEQNLDESSNVSENSNKRKPCDEIVKANTKLKKIQNFWNQGSAVSSFTLNHEARNESHSSDINNPNDYLWIDQSTVKFDATEAKSKEFDENLDSAGNSVQIHKLVDSHVEDSYAIDQKNINSNCGVPRLFDCDGQGYENVQNHFKFGSLQRSNINFDAGGNKKQDKIVSSKIWSVECQSRDKSMYLVDINNSLCKANVLHNGSNSSNIDFSFPENIVMKPDTNDSDTIKLDYSSDGNDNLIVSPVIYSQIINTSVEQIHRMVLTEEEHLSKFSKKINFDRLKFKTRISPGENTNAEHELRREISKDMFSDMDIVGQFNLGFIVVRLNEDLFIIDQHATDEKYNFEMLQKTTVMQNQPLVVSQPLELDASNEMILIENLQIFEKNGFKFQIDENAPVRKKVKLTAKPFSRNWEFGKQDIEELLFMLEDAPLNTWCRPSRVRAMLASRACRKSVMIGTPLTQSIMRRIVNHMGELESPWNCPHGRPTMRHLINFQMLNDV